MGEGPITWAAGRRWRARYYAAIAAAVVLGAGAAVGTTVAGANAAPTRTRSPVPATAPGQQLIPRARRTATPIKHVVVIFDENESFDHYFGTYPYAANTDGSSSTPSRARRR